MKAIQTRYKGYRFRSRLEARWTVFFDALGVRWEYEPEGYVDDNGRCYLPDFLLAGRLFVEIKPMWLPDEGIVPLIRDSREKWGGFLAGDPTNDLLVFFGLPRTYGNGGIPGHRYYADHRMERIRLLTCRKCGAIAWTTHGFYHENASEEPNGFVLRCGSPCRSERWPIFGDKLEDAISAATSARFEHGESGAG